MCKAILAHLSPAHTTTSWMPAVGLHSLLFFLLHAMDVYEDVFSNNTPHVLLYFVPIYIVVWFCRAHS